ncbi:hypothetical protein [Zwartia vadi]|uniref:hypothetical protein n=1 Tax=Zwartia vadi TaxID=3058168 RepID=UPI0025B3304C|nr:hypothetical protein [Zwartia vadi]MDN3988868.1 hypothetical protein [Zwartia vadi]
MKAFLIDPLAKQIREVQITGQEEELRALLEARNIEYDDISRTTDRLCFDEDCFISQKPGRFQLDTLAPVAGKALVLGSTDARNVVHDVSISLAEIESRIQFI